MATQFQNPAAPELVGPSQRASLTDPAAAILGPWRDALLFWGAPVAALLVVQLWVFGWNAFASPQWATGAMMGLFGAIMVLTWAHLIAVVPRAYFNPEVFAAYRTRLTVVPVVLIAALLVSPLALAVAGVVAVLWDVHHSAMQNFGFARIYDMKAKNPPHLLRATDLRLNWILYVGPIAAGASLISHAAMTGKMRHESLAWLASGPGVLASQHDAIRIAAILAYAAVIAWAVVDYARAIRAGYRLPPHKLATIAVSGAVSLLAWGFSPPIVAFAAINLYHAVQYFALVWTKEGARIEGHRLFAGRGRPLAAIVIGGGCLIFGLGYAAVSVGKPGWLLAPFIACSLLHFWYDSFVWSVRKRQV